MHICKPAPAGTAASSSDALPGVAGCGFFCRWVVRKTLGLAGIRALDNLTVCCCERSNPTLQIGYLIIWSVGYGLYWQHVFKLLPNLYAAEYHL